MREKIVIMALTLLAIGCMTSNDPVKGPLIITTTHTTTTTSTLPPIVYKTYMNPEYGIILDYPEDWAKTDDYRGAIVLLESPLEDYFDEFTENVNIVANPHGGEILTEKEFRELSLIEYPKYLENYTQINVTTVTVKDRRVIQHTYRITHGNYTLIGVQQIHYIGPYTYAVTFTAEEKKYEKFQRIATEVLNSFERAVSLEITTDKHTYLLGEEVRIFLQNKGTGTALVEDDLCTAPPVKILDSTKNILTTRKPDCRCTTNPINITIPPNETIEYKLHADPLTVGWNQQYYNIRFYKSLCTYPGYQESLNLTKNKKHATEGEYEIQVEYQGYNPHTQKIIANSRSASKFQIIHATTTTTIPTGPFIYHPRNQDTVNITEDDTGINITVYNNQKDGIINLQLKAIGPQNQEYRITPAFAHLNAHQNTTFTILLTHQDIHSGDNITIQIQNQTHEKDTMITIKKQVTTQRIGGLPIIPIADPLSDQKKYQHDKKSPWDS
ncbi:MAG: hypothetical protein ABIH11_05745 [Candidatus Altiarchaeota archaeon]